jgi:hypothetical protein
MKLRNYIATVIVFSIVGLMLIYSFRAKEDEKIEYTSYLQNPKLFSRTVYQLNEVVMGNNFPPMVASRNYVYAAVAAYEVIAAAHPNEYYSLVNQLHGLKYVPKPDKNQPINYELAALLTYIKVGESVTFPAGSMKDYKDSLLSKARILGLPKNVEQASMVFADSVGNAIIAWSKKDNYLETRGAERYIIKNEPGRWVPTPPGYFPAAEPHWAEIRTMVIDSASAFNVPPPPAYNMTDTNSVYYKEVIKIKVAGENLTDEQKHIALFWDDNPFKINVEGHVMFATKKFSPPGHWLSICGIAAEKAKVDFATTVSAMAITSIALFDGFIQCWYIKYKYNMVRPETVINKNLSPTWRPYLQTPAFPEYTCGHSTISSSAAEALTSVYGDNFAYTDSTELEFGIKNRSFTSFRHAADENNWARFYGGIHFHQSCLVSTDVGRAIGQTITSRLKMKKTKK